MTALLFCHFGYCQSIGNELLVSTGTAAIKKQYSQISAPNSRLYNGPEYIFYDKLYKIKQGHQFFNKPEVQIGKVVYDGQLFTEVPMLYDTYLDQVVTNLPSNLFTYRLVNEKVQTFTLQGHTFVRIQAPQLPKPTISTGFYDLLVDGDTKVYAKREKSMEKRAEQGSVKIIFLESVNYFLFKDNTYYPINNLNNFTNFFPNNKVAIQKYARSNKLKFNKENREASLIKIAQYNTSLAH
jgi:hypothetical protein